MVATMAVRFILERNAVHGDATLEVDKQTTTLFVDGAREGPVGKEDVVSRKNGKTAENAQYVGKHQEIWSHGFSEIFRPVTDFDCLSSTQKRMLHHLQSASSVNISSEDEHSTSRELRLLAVKR